MRSVIVSSDILVPHGTFDAETLRSVKAEFTHKNKVGIKQRAMGLGGIPPVFKTYRRSDEGYRFARGGLLALLRVTGALDVEVMTTRVPVAWPAYTGRLRDYQEEAARALVAGIQGCLIGPCGSGKTEVLYGAARRTCQRTLVGVNTKSLQLQWVQRFLSSYAAEPGMIGVVGGIANDDDACDWSMVRRGEPGTVITIATVQSINGNREMLVGYGTFVADELHGWAADTFEATAAACPAHWRLGATATFQRADGYLPMIERTFGPVLYEIKEELLIEMGLRKRVSVILVNTGLRGYASGNWMDDLKAMADDPRRHAAVMWAVDKATGEGSTLILSQQRTYADVIAREMRAKGLRVHTLYGGGKGKPYDCLSCGHLDQENPPKTCTHCGAKRVSRSLHNAQVLEMLNAGRCAAVGTAVADQALDVPRLSRLVVALPSAGGRGSPLSNRFRQQIGRLSRPEGEDPVVYYIHDDKSRLAVDREKAMKRDLTGCTIGHIVLH
jgi:superfamily II DNA or RNA helicase